MAPEHLVLVVLVALEYKMLIKLVLISITPVAVVVRVLVREVLADKVVVEMEKQPIQRK